MFTLSDYRKRYALYRTDTDLQSLHQKVPFIAVWDDHEVANDTWREGAQNHNEGEGDFDERKMQALQAYFEWMPIRPASANDEETIYRSFHFGNLLSLHMMDTRVIARDQQLSYSDYISGSSFNQAQFEADVTSASRTLIGAEQHLWLNNALASSTATWQVLGQQVLMARIDLPVELVTQFEDPDPATIFPAFIELYGIKQRILDGDNTVTDEERERVENVIPYNLDSWDGYEAERDTIFDTARDLDINLVVLAGDTHNAWASNLTDSSDTIVGGVCDTFSLLAGAGRVFVFVEWDCRRDGRYPDDTGRRSGVHQRQPARLYGCYIYPGSRSGRLVFCRKRQV